MLDFGRIFCDALSPRPDGVSYISWTLLNMGGVDLSNAFGMRKIDFQEDFHLELEKIIFFFPTSVSTGREGFNSPVDPTNSILHVYMHSRMFPSEI